MEQTKIALGGGVDIHFHLDVNDTQQQFTLFKVTIQPNARLSAAHYHQAFDETFYGLKGVIQLTIDGDPVELGVGGCYFVPRGKAHWFANTTKETVEMLCYATPGVFGSAHFQDMAAVLNAGGPPDYQKLKAIMLAHGVVPVAS